MFWLLCTWTGHKLSHNWIAVFPQLSNPIIPVSFLAEARYVEGPHVEIWQQVGQEFVGECRVKWWRWKMGRRPKLDYSSAVHLRPRPFCEFCFRIWDYDCCTGFYITHSGCKNLQDQQNNLKKAVPTKKWKTRKDLGKAQRRDLETWLEHNSCAKVCI